MDNFPELSGSIFVAEKEQRYEKVFFKDILYFRAEGGWVDLILIKGKIFRIATNLGNISPQLDQTIFVRVSRKHIINIHHVTAIQGNIVVVGNEELMMGHSYKEDLIVRLPILRTKPFNTNVD